MSQSKYAASSEEKWNDKASAMRYLQIGKPSANIYQFPQSQSLSHRRRHGHGPKPKKLICNLTSYSQLANANMLGPPFLCRWYLPLFVYEVFQCLSPVVFPTSPQTHSTTRSALLRLGLRLGLQVQWTLVAIIRGIKWKVFNRSRVSNEICRQGEAGFGGNSMSMARRASAACHSKHFPSLAFSGPWKDASL